MTTKEELLDFLAMLCDYKTGKLEEFKIDEDALDDLFASYSTDAVNSVNDSVVTHEENGWFSKAKKFFKDTDGA